MRKRDRGPVFFMGVLKLTDRNRVCLTRDGARRLRQELSRRFGRAGEQYFDGSGLSLKVKVCGELFAEPIGLDSQFHSSFLCIDFLMGALLATDEFTIVARDTLVTSV